MNKSIIAEDMTIHAHKENTTSIALHSHFFESLHKEEWKEVKLGEIAEKITSGGTPKSNKGEYYKGIIPWLNTKEVKNNRIYFTEKTITETGLANSSAKWIEKDSVIVAMYGATAGKVAINKIPLTTNQACCNITLNALKADYNFIYYTLLHNFDRLDQMTSGAAQQNLNVRLISDFSFPLPPLNIQQQIAEILSSFDDKIDLLHRQNKTLESLALTLFRHTFIENPNRNEWEEVKIGDYVECVNGYSYKSSELNKSSIALVTLKNFARDGSFNTNVFKEFIGTKFKDSQIVKNGDLVVAHTDITQEAEIIGNPALIIDTGKYKKLIITMDLVKVEPKIEWISKEFLYYLFKTQDFKSHCLGNSNGTTVLHMNRKTILEYITKIPNPKIIMEFTKNVSYFFGKTYSNLLQIQSLQSIRDMLLVEIFSGKYDKI